ncbi:GNAT family N-acetyltransferase [Polynucleobacter kasalickyi]|uniref:GNAT family N-acetyltransferase n=1 Tax=Polynucleobacter kasalickyi TaxID=1938817 RepID=UPI0013577786|nr:GNAT family N-acetyltransferase [Polynucleobacter kasalickyi]
MPSAYQIRYQVFVLEQNISVNLEIDEYDSKARHLILLFNEQAIGTARIFLDHTEVMGNFKIGRLAILQEFRGQGLGKKMMGHLIQYAEENFYQRITLHAQINALSFYEKLGFIADPNKFYEDGVLHQKCTLVPIQRLSMK